MDSTRSKSFDDAKHGLARLRVIRLPVAAIMGMAALACAAASATEIYSGEPLTEALHDLSQSATPVKHALSSTGPLLRTDVFRLADGRLVVVVSRAKKAREPHSVQALRVTASAGSPLTMRLPTVSAVKISP
jgi:hypothetical protein